MTSSMHDLSDNAEPDEQQKLSQPEIQHQSSATGNFLTGITTPSAEYMMHHSQLEVGHAVAQTAYPYIDPFYGGIIAAYSGQTVFHPHLMGMHHAAVPLPTDAVEEPVYVNAKQYHGILRRRQSRAKAESENKSIKNRKPYLHESRHLHALKRARGCGGRFLNAKSEGNQQDGPPPNEIAQPCNGPRSQNSCSGNQQDSVLSREKEPIKAPDSDELCLAKDPAPSTATS